MVYNNLNTNFSKIPNKSNKPNEAAEPIYLPDWHDLETRAKIMITYWQHVAELARIEQALENMGERQPT